MKVGVYVTKIVVICLCCLTLSTSLALAAEQLKHRVYACHLPHPIVNMMHVLKYDANNFTAALRSAAKKMMLVHGQLDSVCYHDVTGYQVARGYDHYYETSYLGLILVTTARIRVFHQNQQLTMTAMVIEVVDGTEPGGPR